MCTASPLIPINNATWRFHRGDHAKLHDRLITMHAGLGIACRSSKIIEPQASPIASEPSLPALMCGSEDTEEC